MVVTSASTYGFYDSGKLFCWNICLLGTLLAKMTCDNRLKNHKIEDLKAHHIGF